eukprot:GHVO01066149.1.p1 GENE.GHVO01066149.1~~GHVO01066149.1.p1  ORF type:complete len:178 (+),score=16.28 GHVO01066149.1:65-598(+)
MWGMIQRRFYETVEIGFALSVLRVTTLALIYNGPGVYTSPKGRCPKSRYDDRCGYGDRCAICIKRQAMTNGLKMIFPIFNFSRISIHALPAERKTKNIISYTHIKHCLVHLYQPLLSCHTPTISCHTPTISCHTPTTSYHTYHTPAVSYHTPTVSYNTPTVSHHTPTVSYTHTHYIM